VPDLLATYTGPLEPFDFTVDAPSQRDYLEALEDHHPRYVSDHDGQSPLIHPGVLLKNSNITRSGSPLFDGPWIHTREETRFKTHACLGERLVVRWHVDKHKPYGDVVLTRASCVITSDRGPEILHRTMWGFCSTGRVGGGAEDAVRAAPPAGSPPSAAGEVSGSRKNVTSERIWLFSGSADQNLHTSDQVAKAAGLAAAVASAAQGMGYLGEFMIDNFGEKWLSGGSWMLTFRKPVFPADQVTVLGRLTSASSDGASPGRTMRVRVVNQYGMTVTDGLCDVPSRSQVT
jgi:acyl dehydratase